MKKVTSTGNRSLMDFFKPKQVAADTTPTERPAKRARTESGGKPLSPSPTPSPATMITSSADNIEIKEPIKDANTSFASMRSTSSKRVVTSSGQQAIMGSDSDSDDLEDLDKLMNFKPKPKPAVTNRLPNSSTAIVVPQRQQQKKMRFDLGRIVEEQKKQTEMETRIAMAQADLHEASKEHKGEEIGPSKDSIKAVLAQGANSEDGDNARRVMEALERTDAFERHDVWHFFEEKPVKPPRNPFPRILHSNAILRSTLNDPGRRMQAFTSGFLQRIAEQIPLPDELLSWLMFEACRERNEFLLTSYITTLQQSVEDTSACLSSESLQRCFRMLGVKEDVLDPGTQMQHSRMIVDEPSKITNTNLVPFVQFLSNISYKLPASSKHSLAHFLIRASFDHGIRADRMAHAAVEFCFRTLLDTYEEDQELDEALSQISKTVFRSIESATLRQQLISSLPGTSIRAHYLKQLLALAFALDKERHLDAVLTNSALTDRLLLLFDKGSALRIKKDTDYVELRARLGLLDVALDCGFSDFIFLETGDKQAEKKFNESIDELATAVRELSARIIDAGAAHMTRTEAKVVAESIVQRLEFAVRTRERPLRDWGGIKQNEEGSGLMKKWVGSTKPKTEGDETRGPSPDQQCKQGTENTIVQAESAARSKTPGISVTPSDQGVSSTTEPPRLTSRQSMDAKAASLSPTKMAIRSSAVSMGNKSKKSMVMMKF